MFDSRQHTEHPGILHFIWTDDITEQYSLTIVLEVVHLCMVAGTRLFINHLLTSFQRELHV